MRRIFILLILISLLPILTFPQLQRSDKYPIRKDFKLTNFSTFYARASVEFLSKQLKMNQTLGSKGRDSRDFKLHYKWARGYEDKKNFKPLVNELVDKFRRMVFIKAEQSKESLANWYALVCTNLARYGVDFGSRQANSRDFNLHKNWALVQPPQVLQNQIILRVNKIAEKFMPFKCLVSGSRVVMADGTGKDIENIKIGDKVKSWDLKKGEIIESTVLKIFNPVHENIIHLIFDKTETKSTADHPYYVAGQGWCSFRPQLTRERYQVEASQLKVGDAVYFYNMGRIIKTRLKSIKEIPGKVKTYTFKLENNNNFFANGILVHTED